MIPAALTNPDPIAIAVLAAVTAQRLAELAYSRFNETRLKASGGVEHGASHYPLIVLLHTAWLVGLWITAGGTHPNLSWLAVFALLQVLRGWVLLTLGSRWTTRIIVVPNKPPIRSGPYRIFAHPNYAIVAAEIFVLPMAFGLLAYAFIFSILNLMVTTIRIHAENNALRDTQSLLSGAD